MDEITAQEKDKAIKQIKKINFIIIWEYLCDLGTGGRFLKQDLKKSINNLKKMSNMTTASHK